MAANIVPTDSPSIFTPVADLSTLEKQAIIRPNNPPPGIAGYVMDIIGEDKVALKSEITDHFVESNTTVQDNIALNPEIVSIRGTVAELKLIQPTTAQQQKIPDPLLPAPGMEPVGTPGSDQTEAETEATSIDKQAAADASQSLWGKFQQQTGEDPSNTVQARIFGYFYQLWQGRQIFSVETPWGFFTSMAIDEVEFNQPEDSNGKSDISIRFKKMRFAEEVTVNVGQLAGRAEFQQSPVTELGNGGLTELNPRQKQSWLERAFGPRGIPGQDF